MSEKTTRMRYPFGLNDTDINHWNAWIPIFNKLGIDPSNIPKFAPPATPPQSPDTPPEFLRFMAPGIPAGNDIANNGAQQSPAAALAQAGLQLAQLGQPTMPTQPTLMAQQQQPPQGLLSPQGMIPLPKQQASNTTDPRYRRGLLDPNYSWSGLYG